MISFQNVGTFFTYSQEYLHNKFIRQVFHLSWICLSVLLRFLMEVPSPKLKENTKICQYVLSYYQQFPKMAKAGELEFHIKYHQCNLCRHFQSIFEEPGSLKTIYLLYHFIHILNIISFLSG